MSSSSARLPPTSRWMRIAITAHSKSALSMRSAIESSASSIGDAEPGLDQGPAELAGHRLGALADDRVEGLGQREAGLEAARPSAGGSPASWRVERLEPPRRASSRGRPTGPTTPSEQRRRAPGAGCRRSSSERRRPRRRRRCRRACSSHSAGLRRHAGGLEPVAELDLEAPVALQRLVGDADRLRGHALRPRASGRLARRGACALRRVGVDPALDGLLSRRPATPPTARTRTSSRPTTAARRGRRSITVAGPASAGRRRAAGRSVDGGRGLRRRRAA